MQPRQPRLRVRLEDDTVRLTQWQMVQLFSSTRQKHKFACKWLLKGKLLI